MKELSIIIIIIVSVVYVINLSSLENETRAK